MYDAEYNAIADQYTRSDCKAMFRNLSEFPTFSRILGDPKGLSFLNMACGDGYYERWLKRNGASRVLGVDLSTKMVQIARKEEELNPLGCSYLVQDCLALELNEHFDVVTGIYLLNYAKTYEELVTFCRVAYQHVKPGGRFIGLNDNPFNLPNDRDILRPYGVSRKGNPMKEGDPIRYEFLNADKSSVRFNNFFFPPERYSQAFEAAGFVDLKWFNPVVTPEESVNNAELWTTFLQYPYMIGFSAQRIFSY